MKNKLSLTLLLLIVFITGCSTVSSLYNFDIPLTPDLAKSQTTELKTNIPREWFTAIDNEDEKIDLWLIENDYRASISFIRINPDEATQNSFGKNDLRKMEEYSKLNHQLAHRTQFIDLLKNEHFELNGRQFYSYQFAGTNNLYRVVVFKYHGKYYECVASIKPGQSESFQTDVYSIQNSVLNSIK